MPPGERYQAKTPNTMSMATDRKLERALWKFATSSQKGFRHLFLVALISSVIEILKATLGLWSDQKVHLQQCPVSDSGQQQMQRRKQCNGQAAD